jgi:acyl transferase domain-containing protein
MKLQLKCKFKLYKAFDFTKGNRSYQRGLYSAKAKKVNSIPGSMAAVGIGEDEIRPFIEKISNGIVTIACVNSPTSTTVSGDEPAIDELKELLESESIFCRKLKVDTAYHSHHMKQISKAYLAACSHIQSGTPNDEILFYSSVSGEQKSTNFGPEYWTENLVSKVRFSEALQSIKADLASSNSKPSRDYNVFIEIGPHSALAGPIRQILTYNKSEQFKYTYLSALIRDKNATQTALAVAAKLLDHGSAIDLKAITGLDNLNQKPEILANLMPYAWEHTSYWYESRLSRDHRFREFPYHDLCGVKDVASNLYEPRWRFHINQDALPWVKDHVIDGFIIFPGSGYLCMVLEAYKQLVQMRKTPGTISGFVLRNVSFSKSIIVPGSKDDGSEPEVELQLTFSPAFNYDGSRWDRFRIFSYGKDGAWSEHCSGLCAIDMATRSNEVDGVREENLIEAADLATLTKIKASSTDEYAAEKFYEDMKNTGNNYGPNFAILDKIYIGDNTGYMKMTIPDISMPYGSMQPHTIHPIGMYCLPVRACTP